MVLQAGTTAEAANSDGGDGVTTHITGSDVTRVYGGGGGGSAASGNVCGGAGDSGCSVLVDDLLQEATGGTANSGSSGGGGAGRCSKRLALVEKVLL